MQTVPIRGAELPRSYQGVCDPKPWDYQTTVVLPVIDCSQMTELCVALLRSQKPKPYLILIDTGSEEEHLHRHLSLRSSDLEVHQIRSNGITHPSQLVASALDLGFSLAFSPWIFTTHQDAFLKQKTAIADLIKLAEEAETPVAGFRMTSRVNDDWSTCVGHTFAVWHLPSCSKIGLSWSVRRFFDLYDLSYHPTVPSWPDTEALPNCILKQHGIKPLLIGGEENFSRNENEWFDHCRSAPGSNLYCQEYYQRLAQRWWEDARIKGLERLARWQSEEN